MQFREISQTNPNNPKDSKEIEKIFDEVKSRVKNPVMPEGKDEPLLSDSSTIDVTNLPSKMMPYPSNSSVKYKPFTYGELLKFNSSMLNETDKIKFVLDGIVTQGFDKSNLCYSDFLFIALLRKLTAFSDSKFKYNFICEECGFENETVANLKDIEFKDLELPSLPVIVDVDENTELHVNPMTIGSYLKLRKIGTDDPIMAYAECVINMQSEKAYNIINNAHGELIDVLEEADRMLGFGSQTLDCKCKSCSETNTFNVGGIHELILPFRESRESTKARIRFK